jgi:hypothetical protein
LEVLPLIVPVGELTHLESASGGTLGIAVDISHTLRESLSKIQAWYFGDSDESCKGNLTNLRRELHSSLAQGNPK